MAAKASCHLYYVTVTLCVGLSANTEQCFDVVRFRLRECAVFDVTVKQADLQNVPPAMSNKNTTQTTVCSTGYE